MPDRWRLDQALMREWASACNPVMKVENIRDMLARRPFEPFRVVMSGGESYEVRHPENAMLVRGALLVGYPVNGNDLPAHFAVCSLMHVAQLEPRSGTRRKRRK